MSAFVAFELQRFALRSDMENLESHRLLRQEHSSAWIVVLDQSLSVSMLSSRMTRAAAAIYVAGAVINCDVKTILNQ